MRRVLKGLVVFLGLGGVALLLGSFLGMLHPVGDSLAVFRIWIAAAVALSALALWAVGSPRLSLLAVSAVALALLGPASDRLKLLASAQAEAPHDLSVYQRNLLHLGRNTEAILAEIEALRPAFITLQEVSVINRLEIVNRLPPEYQRLTCSYSDVGTVVVASRYPFVEGSEICVEHYSMTAIQIDSPNGPLWLVSLHMHWPWPFPQAEQAEVLLPVLGRLEGPMIIGGDFNMVARSHLLRRFEAVSGSQVLWQGRPTFQISRGDWHGPRFTIDHLLLPEGAEADIERLEQLGSDHYGLLARFSLPML